MSAHNPLNIYLCMKCDFETFVRDEYFDHVRAHIKKYKCGLCRRMYAKYNSFSKHMMDHVDEKNVVGRAVVSYYINSIYMKY
jgi:hypothetical protein